MHVMNALKGAGPVHRSFDYDNPPYMPQRIFNLQSTAEIPRLRSGEHRRPADTKRGIRQI